MIVSWFKYQLDSTDYLLTVKYALIYQNYSKHTIVTVDV